MARLNIGKPKPVLRNQGALTHEGAPASPMTAEQALRRSVLSCFLWNDEFYEDGEEIAARILRLCKELPPNIVADLAVEVRTQGNLRHVPLLLLSALAATGRGTDIVRNTVPVVIKRADELTEFLAVHAKVNGVTPDKVKKKLSAGLKKGLAEAFGKFGVYSLAKYQQTNSNNPIKLRDVLFLCHAKPIDAEQDKVWKELIAGTLPAPDTWEVALSTGADKKETFERLIREDKLGYLALLRNLRNMIQAGCDLDLVRQAILARKGGAERVLPFRYIAAARAAPQLEPAIDTALQAAIKDLPMLPGKTIILVDVSASMDAKLSAKSDMMRIDAAAALSAIWPGDVRVFSFSTKTVEVPPRRGMAGVDAVIRSQNHSGTLLGEAVKHVSKLPHDRLIVITDEQAHDPVPSPLKSKSYMINVASNQHGVSYDKIITNHPQVVWGNPLHGAALFKDDYRAEASNWIHIDGFSENVLRFIYELENAA